MSLADDARKERVFIVGHKREEELKAILVDSTCIIHPTLWYENTPNSVLEAFSACKPVITSNIGGMPELVAHDENGMLFPPGDVDALATAINTIMCDAHLQQRYGENSRQRFEKYYTSEFHLSQLVSLFTRLVSNNQHT